MKGPIRKVPPIFEKFELFIRRGSRPVIRDSVQAYLEEYEKHGKENPKKITPQEIEVLWQLRDFLEIFDILYKEPK